MKAVEQAQSAFWDRRREELLDEDLHEEIGSFVAKWGVTLGKRRGLDENTPRSEFERDTVELILAAEEQARAEEREFDCKAVCVECRQGRPVYDHGGGEWWHEPKPGGDILLSVGRCMASAIRARGSDAESK